jgi:hypothetical protein
MVPEGLNFLVSFDVSESVASHLSQMTLYVTLSPSDDIRSEFSL